MKANIFVRICVYPGSSQYITATREMQSPHFQQRQRSTHTHTRARGVSSGNLFDNFNAIGRFSKPLFVPLLAVARIHARHTLIYARKCGSNTRKPVFFVAGQLGTRVIWLRMILFPQSINSGNGKLSSERPNGVSVPVVSKCEWCAYD